MMIIDNIDALDLAVPVSSISTGTPARVAMVPTNLAVLETSQVSNMVAHHNRSTETKSMIGNNDSDHEPKEDSKDEEPVYLLGIRVNKIKEWSVDQDDISTPTIESSDFSEV